MQKRFARYISICLSLVLCISLSIPSITLAKPIIPQATTTNYYINLAQHTGSYDIAGTVISFTTTDATRATYKDNKILAHTEGIATIELEMLSGSKDIYHISVFYEYPQPKIAIIQASGDSSRLYKWAKAKNTVYEGTKTLSTGDRVFILYRVTDQSDNPMSTMQYIRTEGGQSGYISNQINSDRAGSSYYRDVGVGQIDWAATTSGGTVVTDSKLWTSNNEGIAKASLATDLAGNQNQGKVTGISLGIATITTTLEYGSKDMQTSFCYTVYNPVPNIKGMINKATYPRYGASATMQARTELTQGTPVTITGESTNFWRIGQASYVLKY